MSKMSGLCTACSAAIYKLSRIRAIDKESPVRLCASACTINYGITLSSSVGTEVPNSYPVKYRILGLAINGVCTNSVLWQRHPHRPIQSLAKIVCSATRDSGAHVPTVQPMGNL